MPYDGEEMPCASYVLCKRCVEDDVLERNSGFEVCIRPCEFGWKGKYSDEFWYGHSVECAINRSLLKWDSYRRRV